MTKEDRETQTIEAIKALGKVLHTRAIANNPWRKGKSAVKGFTLEASGDRKAILIYGIGGYIEIPMSRAEKLGEALVDAADEAAFMMEKLKQSKKTEYVNLGGEYVSAGPGEYPGMKRYREKSGRMEEV